MSKFSHTDPRYKQALAEMGSHIRRLMEAKDWTQADLMRAASLQMPIDPMTGKPGRMGADNISNMVNGKRRPTRVFVKAVAAALGADEAEFMPAFLRDISLSTVDARPILQEVPGKDGLFRLFIDRELSLSKALKIIAALEDADHAS